jgi:hypothetical protein
MSRCGHKPGRGKEEYLNAFPRLRKFLNQCVVCQETGYDPERIKKKEGKYFQARVREYFHPLEVNESGVCLECARRLASHE